MKYLFNYILLKILRAYVSSTIIDTLYYILLLLFKNTHCKCVRTIRLVSTVQSTFCKTCSILDVDCRRYI